MATTMVANPNTSGLNNAQIVGLIGTTTANLLSSYNTISQATLSMAATELQAGTIIANAELQIGSNIANANFQSASSIANARYQEGAAIANAEMAAGRGLAKADLLVSDLKTSAVMANAQTGIESDLPQILRAQQSQDLQYQSQRLETEAAVLGTQVELSKAEGQARKKELLRTFNKADVNTVMMAVAQGRSGATIGNLRAQDRANADRDIELSKLTGEAQRAGLSAQQAMLIGDSKAAALASQSVEATSLLEQQTAQMQIDYTNSSTAAKVKFTADSAASEAAFGKQMALSEGAMYVEAAQANADYMTEITNLQNEYTRESSILTAQTMKTQSDIAGKTAITSGIIGAVASFGTTYAQYKAIR